MTITDIIIISMAVAIIALLVVVHRLTESLKIYKRLVKYYEKVADELEAENEALNNFIKRTGDGE